MADQSDTLTAKQHKAIAALLSEPTIGGAAAKVGIGERTLYAWLADPEFAQAYRGARVEAVRQAMGRLQQVASESVQVLIEVMNNPAERGATRIVAAKAVLETAFKAVELEDLEASVTALEEVSRDAT